MEKVKPQIAPYKGREGNILLSCLGQRFMNFFLCSSAVLSTVKNHWPWRYLIRTELASVGRTKCQECIGLHPHFYQQAGHGAGNSVLLALISNCPARLASLLLPNEGKYDALRFDLLLRTPAPPTSHPLSCVP